MTQITSILELPNVYFQNLLLIHNTPDNIHQPQMHICPLPCTPFEQKLAWVSIFLKNSFQIDAIWELPNVYFQNLLLISNTPANNLQPQMHICPLPCTPFEQKLAWVSIFLKNSFQIDAIWEWPKVYFQNLLLVSNTPDDNLQPQRHICPLPCTPFEQKIGLSQHIFKEQFPNWRNLRVAKGIFSKSTPDQLYTGQQSSTSNAYLSTPMHTLWAKIGLSLHIFKK